VCGSIPGPREESDPEHDHDDQEPTADRGGRSLHPRSAVLSGKTPESQPDGDADQATDEVPEHELPEVHAHRACRVEGHEAHSGHLTPEKHREAAVLVVPALDSGDAFVRDEPVEKPKAAERPAVFSAHCVGHQVAQEDGGRHDQERDDVAPPHERVTGLLEGSEPRQRERDVFGKRQPEAGKKQNDDDAEPDCHPVTRVPRRVEHGSEDLLQHGGDLVTRRDPTLEPSNLDGACYTVHIAENRP
jgi:hypothetical protein